MYLYTLGLNLVKYWNCITLNSWTTLVPSSSQEEPHVVSYKGCIKGEHLYTCTCPYYTNKKKKCSHIKSTSLTHCRWSQITDGLQPLNNKCPQCGQLVELREWPAFHKELINV